LSIESADEAPAARRDEEHGLSYVTEEQRSGWPSAALDAAVRDVAARVNGSGPGPTSRPGRPPVRSATSARRRPTVATTLVGTALSILVLATAAEAQGVDGTAPRVGQKIVLVTGSTGGLGREVARRLGAQGAHVIIHGRDLERGRALVEEIERGDGSARFYAADLASFQEVRALAAAILRDYPRLDVLVNNAGIWLEPEAGRQVSDDGHELHFQVNYLSGFLLTRLLLPRLRTSAPARIVNVASIAQRPIDFDDVMLDNGYSDGRAYAQSKLAQVMFTFDLARELADSGVTVDAVHPATMMNTDMVLERGARPRATIDEGAEAVMNLIAPAQPGSGRYFNGMRPADANEQAYDVAARARLRRLSEALTGVAGL
jgi:NAD(P)-dependent dehydrogenase (short-subunit alcohol dehydrogenase family)